MNTLELCNQVARLVVPPYREYEPFTSLDMPFAQSALDSLEVLMCAVYLCEIYGVSDEESRTLPPPKCWSEMLDGVAKFATREVPDVATAMGYIV